MRDSATTFELFPKWNRFSYHKPSDPLDLRRKRFEPCPESELQEEEEQGEWDEEQEEHEEKIGGWNAFLRKSFCVELRIFDKELGRHIAQSAEKVETSDLEAIFSGLAKSWQESTGGLSTTTRRYAHPSYQAILVLGEDVVPLILRELQQRPDWWFEALKVLTKQNPVKTGATFEEAVNAWIEWGKK